MGRHEVEIGKPSYLSREEAEMRKRIRIILHKCCKIAMHNGTHIGSLIALHVVALTVMGYIPFLSKH